MAMSYSHSSAERGGTQQRVGKGLAIELWLWLTASPREGRRRRFCRAEYLCGLSLGRVADSVMEFEGITPGLGFCLGITPGVGGVGVGVRVVVGVEVGVEFWLWLWF